MKEKITRPLLRYHGGKWRIAPWIISQFPPHRFYIEPYSGAASVLMRKPRTHVEVLNDLDGEITNLFEMVRDRGNELAWSIEATPWARNEYTLAYEPSQNPLERARRLMVRSAMGFGTNSVIRRNGFLGKDYSPRSPAMSGWGKFPAVIQSCMQRLSGVVIESIDAIEVIKKYDDPDALFYVDPPYLKECRQDSGRDYRYEMTTAEHISLSMILHAVRGVVVLSGYPSPVYDELYADWRLVEHKAWTCHGSPRTEILWIKDQRRAAR